MLLQNGSGLHIAPCCSSSLMPSRPFRDLAPGVCNWLDSCTAFARSVDSHLTLLIALNGVVIQLAPLSIDSHASRMTAMSSMKPPST